MLIFPYSITKSLISDYPLPRYKIHILTIFLVPIILLKLYVNHILFYCLSKSEDKKRSSYDYGVLSSTKLEDENKKTTK